MIEIERNMISFIGKAIHPYQNNDMTSALFSVDLHIALCNRLNGEADERKQRLSPSASSFP
jgi:hypothetical protein